MAFPLGPVAILLMEVTELEVCLCASGGIGALEQSKLLGPQRDRLGEFAGGQQLLGQVLERRELPLDVSDGPLDLETLAEAAQRLGDPAPSRMRVSEVVQDDGPPLEIATPVSEGERLVETAAGSLVLTEPR